MFFNIIREILKGKSLIRTLMNLELKNHNIYGQVLDVGGGINPSYYNFLQKKEGININTVDGKNMNINLEKDKLPADNNSADCILMFNILEHIYNHNFLVKETSRIIKKQGVLLGFVPFLINYHPDPRDYFRYTSEALQKIFTQAGYNHIKIKEIGGGPAYVNYNNLMFAFPKVTRVAIFPFYYLLDKILLKLKPQLKQRYPLGYLFMAHKE